MRFFAVAFLAGLLFSQPAPSRFQDGRFKNPANPAILGWGDIHELMARDLYWTVPAGQELLCGTEDSIYIAPTEEDIVSLFKFYRWRREGLEYVPEGWDCDNTAREFKYLADVWAVRYYDRTRAALAVGMCYVRLNGDVSDIWPHSGHRFSRGYHVLGVILRSDGQWLFFEPQTGQLVPVESMIYEGSIEILKVNL